MTASESVKYNMDQTDADNDRTGRRYKKQEPRPVIKGYSQRFNSKAFSLRFVRFKSQKVKNPWLKKADKIIAVAFALFCANHRQQSGQ